MSGMDWGRERRQRRVNERGGDSVQGDPTRDRREPKDPSPEEKRAGLRAYKAEKKAVKNRRNRQRKRAKVQAERRAPAVQLVAAFPRRLSEKTAAQVLGGTNPKALEPDLRDSEWNGRCANRSVQQLRDVIAQAVEAGEILSDGKMLRPPAVDPSA